MNDDTPPGFSRRSFIGTSLAVATGAGVGAALVKAAPARADRGARFVHEMGSFPDCPVAVEVALPSAREGARGRAWLHIRTPREHLVRDLGEVPFRRGAARVETTLAYPYAERVPGDYSYHVEVACAGEHLVTEAPATYAVKKIYWFC